ncbi:MAG: hypothetical protein L3K05_06285, partial [Thermoplasmata archaeon]|nr:hypothetical protein [Thermoplasmata archaeon]
EPGSRHAVGFKDNIAEAGILNEFKLVRQTYGPMDLLRQLPQGIKVARKKPEILKKPDPIEGLDEVRAIYKALDPDAEDR